MRYERSDQFKRSFKKFPIFIREAFYKQVGYLLRDLKHPSLRAKKYDEATGLWQARITKGIRFFFLIDGDKYYLVNIEKHKD